MSMYDSKEMACGAYTGHGCDKPVHHPDAVLVLNSRPLRAAPGGGLLCSPHTIFHRACLPEGYAVPGGWSRGWLAELAAR